MIDGRTVCAILPLHYGKNFLEMAMSSVIKDVDEFVVMYTPRPNHGKTSSPIPCPDTRDELLDVVFNTVPYARWYDCDQWPNEGAQFDDGRRRTDADIVIKLDADEIWAPGLLRDAVRHGIESKTREVRVGMRHYWRSFYKAFTQDPAFPGRIYFKEFTSGETSYNSPDSRHRIHHLGYCETLDIVRYKMSIHGHINEFRNDVNWFEDVYKANRQTDCHPIGSDSWSNPDDVVPLEIMLNHPFAKLEIIE